jgi:hypothetical protein
MLDWFFAYGTLVVGTLVAFAALLKDAEDYVNISKKRGKFLLLALYVFILFLLAGGIYQTYETRSKADIDRAQALADRLNLDKDRIQEKQDKAVSESKLQGANDSLQRLQDKVDQLQTKAQTQKLSLELSDVTRELQDAKSKLQQPRAKFVATFATSYYDKIPIVETVGERTLEGIKVNFGVMNTSGVAALKGMIVIRLCDGCQFATEPSSFTKPTVGPEDERLRNFDTIQEHAIVQDMSATVIPPLGGFSKFLLAVMVKCEDCEPGHFMQLIVDVPPVVPPDFRSAGKKNPKSKP